MYRRPKKCHDCLQRLLDKSQQLHNKIDQITTKYRRDFRQISDEQKELEYQINRQKMLLK